MRFIVGNAKEVNNKLDPLKAADELSEEMKIDGLTESDDHQHTCWYSFEKKTSTSHWKLGN